MTLLKFCKLCVRMQQYWKIFQLPTAINAKVPMRLVKVQKVHGKVMQLN